MRYQCEVVITASLDQVVDLFLKNMIRNKAMTAGNQITFAHDFGGGHEVMMRETIEHNDLPQEIVTIYEIEGVWNRCVNSFVEEDGKVSFTIDSHFVFQVPVEADLESFKNATQGQLEWFKTLVEKQQNLSIE